MWASHPQFPLLQDAPRSCFLEAFKWILAHASYEELNKIGPCLWACWMCMNKMVMDQTSCDVQQLATSLSKLIIEYQSYNQKISCTGVPRTLSFQRWNPLSNGWIKVNFDAHVGSNLRRGLGIVFRDAQGRVLLTDTRRISASWIVPISEAATALFGLEVAKRMGYETIHLEGDSMTVQNLINKMEDGLTYLHAFLDAILELRCCFFDFKCSFVCRHGNTVAHMVARWDTGNAMEKICMAPFPPSLQTLVDLDLQ